jgi:hypothetical protein
MESMVGARQSARVLEWKRRLERSMSAGFCTNGSAERELCKSTRIPDKASKPWQKCTPRKQKKKKNRNR